MENRRIIFMGTPKIASVVLKNNVRKRYTCRLSGNTAG